MHSIFKVNVLRTYFCLNLGKSDIVCSSIFRLMRNLCQKSRLIARTTHGSVRRSHRSLTVIKTSIRQLKCYVTSSLILVKMIARFKRTLRNAYQSKDKTQAPQTTGAILNFCGDHIMTSGEYQFRQVQ